MSDVDQAPAEKPALTIEQAADLCGRYATIVAQRLQIEARRQLKLGRINAAADRLQAPFVDELEQLLAQIKPWWTQARSQLLVGKRKSTEIGGCLIGTKTSPAKIVFDTFADDEAAIAAIRKIRASSAMLKTRVSLDRAAILKQLGASTALSTALKAIGFATEQAELFFLEPLPSAPLGQPARTTQAAG